MKITLSGFEDFFIQALDCLYPDGQFIMEGCEFYLQELKVLAEGLGFINVEVLKDYSDRDRFLKMNKATATDLFFV